MRIDLPYCNFKSCRHYFGGNCTKKSEYDKCIIRSYDDFPLCSISGCEAASKDCHRTCKDSLENKKFFQFVDFLAQELQRLHESSSGDYKGALEDISFYVCDYLDQQGYALNRTYLTAEYLDSLQRKKRQHNN